MFRLTLYCSLLAGVLLGQSCSGDPNARPAVEISGTVTLDGAPLKQASIQFTSSKTGESAYTNLDDNGHYSLSFAQADVGSAYEVTVSTPVVDEENAMALAEKPQEKSTVKIPAKYSKRTTSGLIAQVNEPGANTANFELKSN
ncbi:carboxypeptidase-like regulatory domain-containing protein [Gimesia panareensis]|uniref:Carboxypeptidase regulatory-like domain-containing protein n=1 Tax=Gimesia panareensis TaxID=2527978 RepID=A0A517Q8H8_9PLAN|nr:carboxypeptidase-like regulatory domain-containing protein [Gimesia panareensis]QDT27952.1 hypothetical protein Enr10x_32890 [Gimesia panareensis]QDU50820.1 hypothetical protein Pan110_31800 [Gimesia panareensis]QDV18687.1 hypothetical protein Pan153_33470 [Gimesia panareensis]